MEFVVIQQPFAVAVVILEEEILVIALEQTVVQLDDCIVVELEATAFHQGDAGAEALVGRIERHAGLVYAAIVEDVGVVFAVHERYPEFAVDHKLGIDYYVGAE